MILSLAPLTVLPASPLEQIDAAHAAGFDAVGLRLPELLDALPPGIPLSLEAPASHRAQLSASQRAHAVAHCTRKLLQLMRT